MNEDLSIINTNTRNERIKNFLVKNKKILFISLSIVVIILLTFFAYLELKKSQIKEISENYNSIVIDYSKEKKLKTVAALIEIIKKKNPTYSPLSLYFIIDNKLLIDRDEINELFDILIEKTPLEKEIKNLIIYKKGLYNADQSSENELLKILNPLINSENIWQSHALYLMAEFYFSKDQKQKSKDFFGKILELENANQDIIKEAKKRLNRDLSD